MDNANAQAVRDALDTLHGSYARVDDALKALESQDLSKENADLRETVQQLSDQLQNSRAEAAALSKEYDALKQGFKEELRSKRSVLLGMSNQRHQEYLATGLAREQAKVDELYGGLQATMMQMSANLHELDAREQHALAVQVGTLNEHLQVQVMQARKRKQDAWSAAAQQQAQELQQMDASPLEDAALDAVQRFFQWETFLGLKIISAIGALLILLGTFTFGRYLYTLMTATFQCAAIFVLGLALMGAGELLHRKKWRGGFTLALTASGSGILFLGTALGYMTLDVFSMNGAFAVCVVVSLLTFAAALRYDSQFVAVFALVGGYLPLFALTDSSLLLYGAVYFTLLTLFVLLLSTRKNWRIARFFGLGAGLLAEAVMLSVGSASAPTVAARIAIGLSLGIGFVAYMIIPALGAWFTKTRIIAADIILLAGNIVARFTMGLIFWTMFVAAPSENRSWAFVAVFAALCCIAMALISERQKESGVPEGETGSLRALFFVTSISFVALIVPLAFDTVWFSLGWLVQAVGLLIYGIYWNKSRFSIAGSIIGTLCLAWFFAFDALSHFSTLFFEQTSGSIFAWQYLSVTVGVALVALATLRLAIKQKEADVLLDAFRTIAAFNVWLFALYALHDPLRPLLTTLVGESAGAFITLASITLGFAGAFILPRIRKIYNPGFQAAAWTVGAVSIFWLLIFNMTVDALLAGNTALAVVVLVLYLLVNCIGVMWLNDLLRTMMKARKLSPAWYPLLISGYALLVIVQGLVVQMQLEISSLVVTLVFGLAALTWVIFGFIRRNEVTRISGLSLAFFAVFKLFVIDLHGLETAWQIVSYFTGGVLLLAIAFAYQWFNKRLESDSDKKVLNDDEDKKASEYLKG